MLANLSLLNEYWAQVCADILANKKAGEYLVHRQEFISFLTTIDALEEHGADNVKAYLTPEQLIKLADWQRATTPVNCDLILYLFNFTDMEPNKAGTILEQMENDPTNEGAILKPTIPEGAVSTAFGPETKGQEEQSEIPEVENIFNDPFGTAAENLDATD